MSPTNNDYSKVPDAEGKARTAQAKGTDLRIGQIYIGERDGGAFHAGLLYLFQQVAFGSTFLDGGAAIKKQRQVIQTEIVPS